MTGGEVTGQPRGTVGGRDLPMAIAVGVALAVLFLVSIFWRGEIFSAVILVLVVVAYVDTARTLHPIGVRVLTPVLIVSAVGMMIATHYLGPRGQTLGVVLLFGGSVLALLVEPRRSDALATFATTLLLGLWIAFLASFGVLLIDRPSGSVLVLGVIGAAIFTDIGGYGFGVTLGRHKVAPNVSPNKTWEGLLGGLVIAAVLGAAVLPRLGDTFTPIGAAALAIVCGLASFIGDLTESMVKRDLGVKDLGDLLPGHGGVLDRVDGILFALPVGYYAVVWFV